MHPVETVTKSVAEHSGVEPALSLLNVEGLVCLCLCMCVLCVCLVVCVYERGIGVGVFEIHRLEYVATNERINGKVKDESVCVCCVCVCVGEEGEGGEAFDTRTAA